MLTLILNKLRHFTFWILIEIFFMEGHSFAAGLSIFEIFSHKVLGTIAHQRCLALRVLIHFYLRYLKLIKMFEKIIEIHQL